MVGEASDEVTCCPQGMVLATGLGIGQRCVTGRVFQGRDADGGVFVTSMTSPADIGSLLRAEAVVTEQGDLMCHAAVMSRELGISAVVGAIGAKRALVVGEVVRVCVKQGKVLRLPPEHDYAPSGAEDMHALLQAIATKAQLPLNVLDDVVAQYPELKICCQTADTCGYIDRGDGLIQLTAAGQTELARLRGQEQRKVAEPEWLERVVQEFSRPNIAMKSAFTKFQMRRISVGFDKAWAESHSDIDAVITTGYSWLSLVVKRAPRFRWYEVRLRRAFERASRGDEHAVTGVLVDSLHTVWFELHEDLLQLAGREREG